MGVRGRYTQGVSIQGVGIPDTTPPVLTSSGGHRSGLYASYRDAFLSIFYYFRGYLYLCL